MSPLERAAWEAVPAYAAELTRLALPHYAKVAAATAYPDHAWLDPETGDVSHEHDPGTDRPWLLVKAADTPAVSVFGPIARAAGWAPAAWSRAVGGATPLAATLAGGALGAGVGYLGGRLAEHLLPEEVIERGKLRRTTALIGALMGGAPGAYLGVKSMGETGPGGWKGWVTPNEFMGKEPPAEAKLPPLEAAMRKLGGVAEPGISKEALDGAGGLFLPSIQVDAFNRAVLADPFMTPQTRYGAVGVVQAADAAKGGFGLVSPYDIARVGLGMGAGLAQAYLAGKTLGVLAGLTPGAQKSLQRAGTFAGAVKAVLPGLFGG